MDQTTKLPRLKITTTGQLREFLASILVNVKNGETTSDEARHIVKLAGQINESFYSEIKLARTNIDLGKASNEMGDTPINK